MKARLVLLALVSMLLAVPAVPARSQSSVNQVSPVRSAAFFADGTVRDGFEQYISVVNLSGEKSDVEIRFTSRSDTGAPVLAPSIRLDIEANQRITRSLTEHMEALNVRLPVNLSVRVFAEQEIAAERISYFQTSLAGGVTGANAIMGAADPELVHLFADGHVGPSARQFLTLYYPVLDDSRLDLDPADVDVVYYVEGRGELPKMQVTLNQGDRSVIDVNAALAEAGVTGAARVSARLESTEPIVVERSLFTKGGGSTGGTALNGTDAPASRWYVADALPGSATGSILTVFNAAGAGRDVSVAVRTPDGRPVPNLSGRVEGRDRVRLDVAAHLKANGSPAGPVALDVLASGDVVVERTLTFPGGGLAATGAARFLTHKQTFPHGQAGSGIDHTISVFNPSEGPVQVTLQFVVAAVDGTPVAVPDLPFEVLGGRAASTDVSAYLASKRVTGDVNVTTVVRSDHRITAERFLEGASPAGTAALVVTGFAIEEPDPVGAPRLLFGAMLIGLLVLAAVWSLVRGGRTAPTPIESDQPADQEFRPAS